MERERVNRYDFSNRSEWVATQANIKDIHGTGSLCPDVISSLITNGIRLIKLV